MRRRNPLFRYGKICIAVVAIGFLFAQAAPVQDTSSVEAYKKNGKFGELWGNGIPLTMTAPAMERGRSRYVAYCAVCHGMDGTVSSGTTNIMSLTSPQIRQFSDGETFSIISNGRTNMPAFSGTLTESDRWKIVAYLRALQRNQAATPPRPMSEAMAAEVEALGKKQLEPVPPSASGQKNVR